MRVKMLTSCSTVSEMSHPPRDNLVKSACTRALRKLSPVIAAFTNVRSLHYECMRIDASVCMYICAGIDASCLVWRPHALA
jgi:hypothetical protein